MNAISSSLSSHTNCMFHIVQEVCAKLICTLLALHQLLGNIMYSYIRTSQFSKKSLFLDMDASCGILWRLQYMLDV